MVPWIYSNQKLYKVHKHFDTQLKGIKPPNERRIVLSTDSEIQIVVIGIDHTAKQVYSLENNFCFHL
jgi:hypothetical protein